MLDCVTVVLSGTATLFAGSSRPNILFFFADDLSHEMIHTMGNDRIITPNLDRLAESGMAFTHACIQEATGDTLDCVNAFPALAR